MKRFLSVLLVAAMICALLPTLALAEEETTLRVMWWGSQTRHDRTMAAIAKFEEKNPGVKVDAEFTSFDEYWRKLATQVAGNQVPDVIQMGYTYLIQYANSGVLADLKPYFESGAIDVSDVAESVIASGQVDGHIYALSTGTNCLATFYRKDVADAAGVEVPMDLTYEKVIELSKTVYEKTGRTNNIPIDLDAVRLYVRSRGMQLYNEEGTALGFDDPKYIADLWQMRVDGLKEGWILDSGSTTATTAFDNLISDCWMNQHYSNELQAYQDGNGVTLEMVMYPVVEGGTVPPAFFKPSMFWSISEKSNVKDVAARFIDFFTNDPDCFDIMGLDRAMPVSAKIREYLIPTFDDVSKRTAALLDYLGQEGKSSPIMKPDVAAHGEIMALFAEYMEQVNYGMVDDLTAFAQQFMDEANELITKSLAK
ncbi:MAG: extracellular solute-binding protein [Eubacteriales bacterium]|nr:extracellular solute-binding protein [Eubacteriales bacterium]